MNPRSAAQRSSEDGFTLVELLIATAILGVIAIPLSMGFVTGIRFLGRSDQKFNDSRSALISASYFASDVAGANTIVLNDTSACGGGTAVVSFSARNASNGVGGAVNNEVSYVVDSSDPTNTVLSRRYCANAGTATKSVAAVALGASPVVTCYNPAGAVNATCVGAHWVKMVVTQKANTPTPDVPSPIAYSYTLEGTVRSQ